MVIEPSLPDESEFLYAAQPELLRFRTSQLAVEKVMDWYQSRAEEIEHYALQVRPAVLCQILRIQCMFWLLTAVPGILYILIVCKGRNENFLLLSFIYSLLQKLLWFLFVCLFWIPKEQIHITKAVQNLSLKCKLQNMYILIQILYTCLIGLIPF